MSTLSRALWAAVALAALAGVAGCPDPGPLPGDEDAGTDAGPGAARDAGTDAGAQTPTPDAGVDAGVNVGMDAGVQTIGWANLQWPPFVTASPGETFTVYGQVWIDGVTPAGGAAAALEVEAGLGPSGTAPTSAEWSWTPATFNVDRGNNDEWMATLGAPSSPGTWDYAFRYRHQGGPWLHADRSDLGRAGTNDGYQSENAGRLAVRAAGQTIRVATLNLHCLNDDAAARLDAAAARLGQLSVDVVALQEVCEDSAPNAPVPNAAAYLAQKLSAAAGRAYQHRWVQTHLSFNVTPEGVGLVFALPLADVEVHDLPVGDFARKTQVAVLASPVGVVAVATVHLSFRQEDAQVRLEQANAVVSALDAKAQQGVALGVVAGDLNTIPGTAPIAAMTDAGFVDAWAALHPNDPGFTHRSDNPTRRIDYVFVRPSTGAPATLTTATREFTQPYANGEYVSDHVSVVTELTAQ